MEAREAFLRQARSDFAVFELLRDQPRERVPECHPLHYLQMATEKLAKAAFLALGMPLGRTYTHVAFSVVPHHLRRPDVARALGWRDFHRYEEFLRRSQPYFRAIDELNPSVGAQAPAGGPNEGPNVEYPWRGRNAVGGIVWHSPADHSFGLLVTLHREPGGVQVMRFARGLLDRFEAIFP
jgi:hypothetical protein